MMRCNIRKVHGVIFIVFFFSPWEMESRMLGRQAILIFSFLPVCLMGFERSIIAILM